MGKKKELAMNTVILAVGKICTQFVNFLLLPLYTALLSTADYGTVDLFGTYTSLIVPLFSWSFESGFFRFLLDCRNKITEQRKIVTTVLGSNLMQIVVFMCFYAIIQPFWNSQYKIFLALDVVMTIILNTLLQLPRGLGNNTVYAVGSFISATSGVLLNVVFIAGLRMGALGMFLALIIAKAITIIYLFFKLKVWQLLERKSFNLETFKKIFHYSLPLVPNSLSWWVVGVSDRSLISYFIGVAANGVYSVANKFSSVYTTIYNLFNLSWTESVSLYIKDGDAEEFLTETINTMFRIFSTAGVLLIAYLPIVFPYFVHEDYSAAYNQIPILIIACGFMVIVGLYSVVYVAEKKSVEIAKTSFYAAVINIIVDVVFIQKIGLYAASLSTLAAYVVMAFYRYFHVKKYVNAPLRAENIVVIVIAYGIVTMTYYQNLPVINYIAAIVSTVFAICYNKSFLNALLLQICKIIRESHFGKE